MAQAYWKVGGIVGGIGLVLGFVIAPTSTHMTTAHGALGVSFAGLVILMELIRPSPIGRVLSFVLGVAAVYSGIQNSDPYYQHNSKAIVTSEFALSSICLTFVFAIFLLQEACYPSRIVSQNEAPKEIPIQNPLRQREVEAWGVRHDRV